MAKANNGQQANEWIRLLNLQAHQEGGFYAEAYRSDDHCTLERFHGQTRSCSTSIYYLLAHPASPRSHFHRIQADEIWHFYKGRPLVVHELDEETSSHVEHILDNELTVSTEARPQVVIPHGKWFAAEMMNGDAAGDKDDYTLCGCTCAPGFDFKDFECAKRSYLLDKFPHLKDLITRLTLSE